VIRVVVLMFAQLAEGHDFVCHRPMRRATVDRLNGVPLVENTLNRHSVPTSRWYLARFLA
jgi:hypothetical protein